MEEHKHKADIKWDKLATIANAIATIVIAAATVFYVLETKDMLGKMKDANEKVQGANDQNVKQFYATERPWVHVQKWWYTPNNGDFQLNYIIENVGRLPAKEVQTSAIADSDEHREYLPFPDRDNEVKAALYPGETAPITSSVVHSVGWLSRFKFVSFFIRYKDMAGNPHKYVSLYLLSITETEGTVINGTEIWTDFD